VGSFVRGPDQICTYQTIASGTQDNSPRVFTGKGVPVSGISCSGVERELLNPVGKQYPTVHIPPLSLVPSRVI